MRIQQMTENEKHLRDAAATVLTFFNFFFFPFQTLLQTNTHVSCMHLTGETGRKKQKKTKNQTTKKRNEQIIGKTRK